MRSRAFPMILIAFLLLAARWGGLLNVVAILAFLGNTALAVRRRELVRV